MAAGRFDEVMALRSWRSAGEGVFALDLGNATAELCIARDGSVRLRGARAATLPPDPSEAVGRLPWQPARPEVSELPRGGFELRHGSGEGFGRVEVEEHPFAVRVVDRPGRTLAELRGLAFADDGRSRIRLAISPAEHCFGLGEKSGGLDKRGGRWVMRNRDPEGRRASDPLYVSIPFFMALSHAPGGSLARGIFLDAFAPSTFDLGVSNPREALLETLAGGIDISVFPGPRPSDVLRRFTARVGRGPVPPRWALGHHQSRWSYASEDEVRAVARELRARGIPTDAIHLDIDYMDGFRVFTWHPKRFPNPKELLRELAERGFRVVTLVDPGLKVDAEYTPYAEGLALGHFCRREDGSLFTLKVWPRQAALPDFNRAEVRAWWGELHRPLVDAGVAGIWNDMNEPAGWSQELRIGRAIFPLRGQDLSRVVQADPADPGRNVPHEHVRNLYGHQECRATHGFLESVSPEARPFVLTRSGHAGTQRYAAIWTGDSWSRWSDLRHSLPMLLNLSISGVPFCGADIGGFAFSCTPELFARWIQIGALYPFARTHSMWLGRRQEPWCFGKRVEAIARRALRLRMRLLPYLYALFHEAEASGAPVWRPLFYEFPDDARAAAVEDQVMVGPSLLAAPVLERGARERSVYLPAGVWFDWYDDARYVGPRVLRTSAPLDRLPLFVRGGSLVATQSPVGCTAEKPKEPLILHVFPGADAAAELVEDDGESLAYRRGALARTALRLRDRSGGRLRLEIGKRSGDFEVPERVARVVARGCPPPTAAFLDGVGLEEGAGVPGYAFEQGAVHLRFLDDGEAHSLEIEPAP